MPRDESDERAERKLLELIQQRDELAAMMKFAPKEKIAEGHALLRMMDEKIETAEAAIAEVQAAVAAEEEALDARRRKALDLLPFLDKIEKEASHNKAAMKQLELTRAETLRFLLLDAEERGIPNDDH